MRIYEPITQDRMSKNPSKGSWVGGIYRGSRYEDHPVTREVANERAYPFVLERTVTEVTSYAIHTVKGTERLDNLAEKYYGDPKQWWRIAEANPEHVYPKYSPGTQIRIPVS